MYGLNIDPRNPQGDPNPAELRDLGVEMVRFTFKDATEGSRPDRDVVRFYRQQIEELADVGIRSLVILTNETYPDKPSPAASEEAWGPYIASFAGRAAEIAKVLAVWRPAFQIWNAPDLPTQTPGYEPTLREAVYVRMFKAAFKAIKRVDTGLPVVTAGLASGQPEWLANVIQQSGGRLAADAVAINPYAKRPEPDWPAPDWGTGFVGDLIEAYRQVIDLPLWITEIGVDTLTDENQGDYLRRFYRTITGQFASEVEQVFWFCYADGMAHPFGLIDSLGRPKPAYQAYREVAGAPASMAIEAKAAVSLDRLNHFARYLEQFIFFGERHQATQREMETELRGNFQQLSKLDIWRITQQMLAGSPHVISQQELDGLHALQGQKDLYGVLRSIVLAAHQRTGAYTGRLGVHTRIGAETDFNAATNTAALMQVLSHVQPGNRLLVMDTVKTISDESKLLAPDVFETDVYGQHRNGLIENHAWNLQRLVRAIRDRGYQDRTLFIIRLDGPDGGANVNPFNSDSLNKYEIGIAKLIRYLEAVLPTVPFKLVLGNEPDLPQEREWSDPHADPYVFTLNQFAPAIGPFLKRVARQRPDVTFICPALSANLKNNQLAYFTAMFGQDRPENLVPAFHGYASDAAVLPGDAKNLLEQQAAILRAEGRFRHISGTEIGTGNPFGDCESLSDKGRFDDVVIWLMLSSEHQTPVGQDNHWNFRINPAIDDPTARHLADIVNRTDDRVVRNIRERDGAALQILQGRPIDRPAYAVEYVDHNTPTRMVAGQTNAVSITIRNTSYRTWPAGGPHPVRIGYHWYTAGGSEVPANLWDDNRTHLPFDLLPGDSVTLNCNLGAPRAPGTYEVRWDMVEEQRTWFAWQGVPTLDVSVSVVVDTTTPPPADGLQVSASHNNRQSGSDNLQQAIDNNPFTRWSSRQPQHPGMWFQIDLGQVQTISQVSLNSDSSPRDYPRGYQVLVSTDNQNWTTVAENGQNDGPLNVTFSPRQVRFIRIIQTGSDPVFWWSIHEIGVFDQVSYSARASHNNVLAGADNVSQALDGRSDTRWSSRALQRSGMWFEIDLKEIQTVSGLTLDSAGSPEDYPRGYRVFVAPDRNNWQEVTRKDQNDRALDVSFSPRQARLIYIELTANSDRWWWSIHEIGIKSGGSAPALNVRASHNNVRSGADNIAQAVDSRSDTRWSTRALQVPGMWFEIDLGAVRTIRGLTLDSAGSPEDYPRGYRVRMTTDRNNWQEVARSDENDSALDITFSARQARYIYIEQTGSSDRWWWSIHEIIIKE